MQEEIGAKEGESIRRFMPRLNTQIPNEKNWRKFIQKKSGLKQSHIIIT